MENNQNEILGPNGLIRRRELVRVIVQCLYSLGYVKSAMSLESESQIFDKSLDLGMLESLVLEGEWVKSIDTLANLANLNDVKDESRSLALFCILRQCIAELVKRGDNNLASQILEAGFFSTMKIKIINLEFLKHMLTAKDELGLSTVDDGVMFIMKQDVLKELKNLLQPITVPERRLETLVEMALISLRNSCVFHNVPGAISLYGDHSCGKDSFPSETVEVLRSHQNEVWFLQFSNNGQYLASSSSDCTAIIWKVPIHGNLTLEHILRGHKHPVSFLSWNHNDRWLLTCENEGDLKLWNVRTGACRMTLDQYSPILNSCAWLSESEGFVFGSLKHKSIVYNYNPVAKEIIEWSRNSYDRITDLATTPNCKYVICVYSNGEILIKGVDVETERVIKEESAITSVSVSKDGEYLLVNLNNQEIHMWDIAGTLVKPSIYMGHKHARHHIYSCFGGLDSMFIASGSEDSKVYIWNRRNSMPIEILSGHSKVVNCVSWNPKRPQMLASASDDRTIRIWGPTKSN